MTDIRWRAGQSPVSGRPFSRRSKLPVTGRPFDGSITATRSALRRFEERVKIEKHNEAGPAQSEMEPPVMTGCAAACCHAQAFRAVMYAKTFVSQRGEEHLMQELTKVQHSSKSAAAFDCAGAEKSALIVTATNEQNVRF